MNDLQIDMAILKHRMQSKYNIPDAYLEQTILDFTKQKQAHSQYIRDFYENKRVIPLNFSVGYISYLLIYLCDQLQQDMQQKFMDKDPAIVSLLRTRGKRVLDDVLNVARRSLEEYRTNATSIDLECYAEDLAQQLFANQLRQSDGLECLLELLS